MIHRLEMCRKRWMQHFNSPLLKYLFLLFVVSLFMLRICVFVFQYVGIEHDSGWYLGVARNVAQRGIYASYSNSAKDNAPITQNIWNRPSVQDESGFVYFPAGVTVGPGYVLPEALLLKIFGFGWWQYRLWPLICFAALLYTLFYLAWELGGFISSIILQVWLWAYPQLYFVFAYESFSEHIAILFLLLSFLCIRKASMGNKNSFIYFFLAGILSASAIETKTLFLIPVPATLILMVSKNPFLDWKKNLTRIAVFISGFILPVLSFSIYRFETLIRQFGKSGYDAVLQEEKIVFENAGSGINRIFDYALNMPDIFAKLKVWSQIGIADHSILPHIFIWILFFLLPFSFFRDKNRKLIFALYASALLIFLWFFFLGTTNWVRHAYGALLITVLLFAVWIPRCLKFSKAGILASTALLLILPHTGLFNANLFITYEYYVMRYHQRFDYSIQGFPHAPPIPLQDQKEIINFIADNIKDSDRIYYGAGFQTAEISTLADRVFYSLERRAVFVENNLIREYVIISPYQRGQFAIVNHDCGEGIFENDSYKLCLIQ